MVMARFDATGRGGGGQGSCPSRQILNRRDKNERNAAYEELTPESSFEWSAVRRERGVESDSHEHGQSEKHRNILGAVSCHGGQQRGEKRPFFEPCGKFLFRVPGPSVVWLLLRQAQCSGCPFSWKRGDMAATFPSLNFF